MSKSVSSHILGTASALRRVAAVALLALGTMPLTVPALAQSAVPVPRGFQNLCIDHPLECKGGGAHSVRYDQKLVALMDRVNLEVNRRIRPVRNEVIDVWSINVDRGDCEEYVLAKRKALIAAGVPASALSIVYALRNGGGHAILAVHTSNGSFALDNKSTRVKPLSRTGYQLVSMSGPNPKVWHRISRTLIASNR